MKGKAIIPLALGLCLALVAVKLVVDTLRKAKASGTQESVVTVVVAKEDIQAHVEITLEMVQVIETSESVLIPADQRFSTSDDLVGGKNKLGRVSEKFIPKGSPVLANMLAPPNTKPGMVGRIPRGYRAVSVQIDEVASVAYQINPGDKVDVIVVMDVKGARGKKDTIAEVILQNIQVAAIGQSRNAQQSKGKMKPAKSATLLVSETEVPKLHLASTRGKITLAMRGDDTTISQITSVASGADFEAGRREAEALLAREKALEARPESATNVRVQPRTPFGMMVFRGGPTGGIQSFTFAGKKSRKILALSAGPINSMSSIMKANSPVAQPQATPGTIDIPEPVNMPNGYFKDVDEETHDVEHSGDESIGDESPND